MARPGIFVRVHLRLRQEQGFSLIETVVALGTIFVSLTFLAYSATAGFRFIALGRERQAASQIADQLMEQARALSFSDIQNGLNSSEVTTADPNLVTGCTGDPTGTFRFKSCSGETIIKSSFAPGTTIPPLVPHTSTIGRSQGYPIDYITGIYVTNNDPTNNAYRVTVVVSWSGGTVKGAVSTVQTQSLFAAPSGCTSGDTHPFPAPCQPFFFGSGQAVQGTIDVTIPPGGVGVSNTTFQSGSLFLTGASSSVQQEQVAQIQGSFLQTGVQLIDASQTQAVGGGQTTLADSDPTSGALTYSRAPTTDSFAGTGGSVSTGTGTVVTFSNTSGDTGESDSAVTADATNPCPPFGAAETDGLPCGGSRVGQAGTLFASATLANLPDSFALGTATLASVGAPSASTTALVNRTAISGSAGNLQQSASRSIGRVVIGGVPSNLPAPSGFEGFIVLDGYSDAAQSTVGTSAAGRSASIGAGATLRYWDGAAYTTLSDLTQPFTLPATSVVTVTQGAHTVVVQLSGAAAGAVLDPVTPDNSPVTQRTDETASVTPPLTGQFRYTVTVDGITQIDLLITVDLGTLSAAGMYQPAPVQ